MSIQSMIIYSLIIFLLGFLLSYIFSFASRRWAILYGALNIPTSERQIHKIPIPQWGGLGIAITLGILVFILSFEGSVFSIKLQLIQVVGFVAGIAILNFGGMLDDKYDLKAWQSILFPVVAALIVILTGTSIRHVTNPGTSMPFYLDWLTWSPFGGTWSLVFPADLITFVWLMIAMYATKIADGLDGLVTGITVIGAAMVGALSAMPAYYQPISTILSAAVAGSFAGFLPRNIHPAKQFLGEGGSTMAGFSLGFLAIMSSAKIAIALAVLAIPVADILIAITRRIKHHKPWYKADKDHLHHRLLDAGIGHRQIVYFLWLIVATAGVAALLMQTRGKIFLVLILVLLTFFASWLADKAIQKKLPLNQNKK
ncbi:undecaprenyl/decaprenyl-phosphate alpha-N-acetylglucosaminyl 1-phosphate transferase [Patescibacteria group bacterium]|nr:undecaprenyl/decaprenyl-phosphate alpha-N-acetylglucosaminyl 1-phosphate transferase [Patescibacteria group bacterium]